MRPKVAATPSPNPMNWRSGRSRRRCALWCIWRRKIRGGMPRVQVQYVSATSIGMFEQTNPHYGEIWYYLDGRKTVSRIVTAEGVLEAIYSIANVAPPVENDEEIFRGHPL